MVLALDDREQAAAADAEVGPLVAGAADALDLVAEGLEQLGDEFLEPLGGQRGELLELQVGAAGLVPEPLRALPALADPRADPPPLALVLGAPPPFALPRVAL